MYLYHTSSDDEHLNKQVHFGLQLHILDGLVGWNDYQLDIGGHHAQYRDRQCASVCSSSAAEATL